MPGRSGKKINEPSGKDHFSLDASVLARQPD
jgi:hypothetical protein